MRFFAAVPPDVRKGCAFPAAAVLDLWGAMPRNDQSPAIGGYRTHSIGDVAPSSNRLRRKGGAFRKSGGTAAQTHRFFRRSTIRPAILPLI
jgi:hypothetical protein